MTDGEEAWIFYFSRGKKSLDMYVFEILVLLDTPIIAGLADSIKDDACSLVAISVH